jgi:23S rRNA (cytosine1962-C5)-methyltransferase
MKRVDVRTTGWGDYELIDSGEGRKLERFGDLLTDRPDPQALWRKRTPDVWQRAKAQFLWKETGERWKLEKGIADSWNIHWNELVCTLSLKGFKHLGIFPEHESQWKELAQVAKQTKSGAQYRMLNLFGYTGIASMAAASAGAKVTHIDASKQTIGTLKENMEASGLSDDAIRTVCEDAFRYAKRLVQRGEQFEMIVMDPPAFGRGPKGEVWKIEEKLRELIALIPDLLSTDAQLVILNGYASGYAAQTFGEVLADVLKDRGGEITYGDVGIVQKGSDRTLTTGIYGSWRR